MQYFHHFFSRISNSRAFLMWGTLFLFPAVVFAQMQDVFSLSQWIYELLARLGTLFWALAAMLFIWGIVKFIANGADTAEHEKGKQFIVWGLIALFVLASLWGIAEFILSDTLNVGTAGEIPFIDKTDGILLN